MRDEPRNPAPEPRGPASERRNPASPDGPPWPVYQSTDPNGDNYLEKTNAHWQSTDPKGRYYRAPVK